MTWKLEALFGIHIAFITRCTLTFGALLLLRDASSDLIVIVVAIPFLQAAWDRFEIVLKRQPKFREVITLSLLAGAVAGGMSALLRSPDQTSLFCLLGMPFLIVLATSLFR
jgi:4-hydroxybenzoate polyprenyltransferase